MIRSAERGDEQAIMELIHALALYEKAPEEVVNTAHDLGVHLFDEKICDAFVAEVDEKIIGFALFYTNYIYDIEFLEKYVNYFNEKTLLQTQMLTAKFCIIYILDMDIDNGIEDSYLFDIPYILSYQTHITKEEIYEAYNKYFKYNVFELYREKMNENKK